MNIYLEALKSVINCFFFRDIITASRGKLISIFDSDAPVQRFHKREHEWSRLKNLRVQGSVPKKWPYFWAYLQNVGLSFMTIKVFAAACHHLTNNEV